MATLPMLLGLVDELDRETSYYGNDFGFGLLPRHIHRHPHAVQRVPLNNDLAEYALPLNWLSRMGEHPRHQRALERKEAGQHSAIGKDGFQVCMDVGQFKPKELTVKVVDHHVVIEGKHDEREDGHGHISRHFVRRYSLPKSYNADNVVSTLSSDGVLTVSVPKPQITKEANQRIVHIQQTGPAHLSVKENQEDKSGEKEAAAVIGSGNGNDTKQ